MHISTKSCNLLFVDNEEANKENVEYSRKRSILEIKDKSNKSKQILKESDITNVSSISQGFMEEVQDLPLLPSTTNALQKSKISGQKSFKPLSIFRVSQKKHLSPKGLAIFKETKRLRRKVHRLQHWKKTIKRSLQKTQKVITSENIQSLLDTLSPFQRRFFEQELKNARRKPKGRQYTLENKLDALILWKASPSTYRMLNRLGFSLPSTRTLKKLLSSIPISCGISDTIFNSIHSQVTTMQPKEKFCILLFDEMSLAPHIDYDIHADEVVGFTEGKIADHATVFMLKGVFHKWKQPVGFMFNKSAMPATEIVKIVKEIVAKCELIELNVISTVCDQGANNAKAIKLLLEDSKRQVLLQGGEVTNEVIIINNTKVIPLFDPPHLLKSMRNNLLTKDLRFTYDKEQKRASWSHMMKAYDIDRSNNIRVMKKLNDHHILPEKVRKMKVSVAAQVFSESVASGLKYYALSGLKSAVGKSELSREGLDTACFVSLMDKIFDSVNGSFSNSSGKLLRGFVSPKSQHKAEWLKALKVFDSMEFQKSKPSDRRTPPVLSGWKMTIKGFLEIKKTLMNFGFTTFAPRMFNQDSLENFLCQMRQYGIRNTNPSCSSFAVYYKALLIKNIHYHPKTANCEDDLSSLLLSIKEMLKTQISNEESNDR